MTIKTICFFGIYRADYSRNRVLMKGLKANGINVIECSSQKQGIEKYFDLIRKHSKVKGSYDVMFVAFPGYQAAILAWFITSRPIVFDAFCSLYNTAVEDRKKITSSSLKAYYYKFLDWLSCTVADKVLLDTNAHIDYFIKTFSIKREKFLRVFVGTDSDLFYPEKNEPSDSTKFTVHFHGSYIPLQGIEYIIQAAHILKDTNITFNLIGHGQTYQSIQKLVDTLSIKNVRFIKPVPYNTLRSYITQADVCLGIFGSTIKAGNVIPNKVFEALACGKPVITADTAATRELLVDGQDVVLCQKSNPQSLADKIMMIKNNSELARNIGNSGRIRFEQSLQEKYICSELLNSLRL